MSLYSPNPTVFGLDHWIVLDLKAGVFRCDRCGDVAAASGSSSWGKFVRPSLGRVLNWGGVFHKAHHTCLPPTREVTDGPHPG